MVVALFAIFAAGAALASECVVAGGVDSFAQALSQASSGGCVTDSATYRNLYNEFFPGVTEFQVIKWTASDEVALTGDIGTIRGGDKPLVIIAGPDAAVKLAGARGLTLAGGAVIIDHLTIEGSEGNGISMQGEKGLVIRSRIISSKENGIIVTGKNNRIVGSEIASNGLNGILIGGTVSSCGSASQAGAGTTVAGSYVHDNGNFVSGTSCADTASAASIGSCNSLKLEAERCFELLKEEPPCEEPSIPPDDSCGRNWNARNRCADLWSKAAVGPDASQENAVAAVYAAFPGAQGGSGIVVDARGAKITSWEPASDSGPALFINRIHKNRSRGIYVNTFAPAAICQEPSDTFDLNLLQTAFVSETPVDDLFVSRFPLPTISQLSATEGAGGISVTGNVILRPELWYLWNGRTANVSAFRADVFLKSGDEEVFAGSAPLDSSGRFVVHVTTSVSNPTFTAAVVDTERGNTSPFAGGHSASPTGDDDGDGLSNDDEDSNHNGAVDSGETDPINPDSDGDGVLDGDEKTGKLDPLNADSDGDCLPDGLELGVSKEEALSLIAKSPAKPRLAIPAQCQAILSAHTVSILDNAIKYDETKPATYDNVSMLYDTDPSSVSDPALNDTDADGMKDGQEDFNFNGNDDVIDNGDGTTTLKETDPSLSDSDGDGIPDGEEGDKDSNGKIGPNESDPVLPDTDGDGVNDGQEERQGTYPNACDSDEDGLSDGVEVGAIRPASAGSSCHGLEAAGTNYKNRYAMDPLNPDADGDGLMDGVEDANGNGWIEAGESDPSDPDTDRDGLQDGVEARGDFDGDGVPDFDVNLITAGPKCSPPPDINDVDCDAVLNAADVDSDDDGCPDAQEGGWLDSNANGIPDVYDNEAKGCTSSGGGTGGITGGSTASESPDEGGQNFETPAWLTDRSGGGACSLIEDSPPQYYTTIILLICVCLLVAFRRIFSGGGYERTNRRVFLLS